MTWISREEHTVNNHTDLEISEWSGAKCGSCNLDGIGASVGSINARDAAGHKKD